MSRLIALRRNPPARPLGEYITQCNLTQQANQGSLPLAVRAPRRTIVLRNQPEGLVEVFDQLVGIFYTD